MREKKRALIYVRISQDKTGEKAGVQRQEEDCRALAKRRAWTVGDGYLLCDNDVSAYSGKPRPAYRAMVEAIKNGEVDAVIVWHPDRLHRSTRELDDFIDLVEATGIVVATVNAGDYDLTTATGRQTARIVAAVARGESEHKSERIRRKAFQLAQQGKVGGGGTRTFGYKADRITIFQPEARLIREAAKRVLAGDSLRSIAADWTRRGIRTPTGKPWPTTSLRRVLLSGRIAGRREHHGEYIAKAVWKPIIDEATHERLRGVLLHPSRRRNLAGNARRYLLTGFLECGRCGAKLVARPRMRKEVMTDDGPVLLHQRAYTCATGPNFRGCGKIGTLAEPVEELVTDAVLAAFDSSRPLTKALRSRSRKSSEEKDLLDAIRDLEADIEGLAHDHYVDKLIGRREYLVARDGLDERMQAAKRRLAQLDHATVLVDLPSGGAAVRAAWQERELGWRRAVLATVVEKVIVNPGLQGRTKFDPERFELVPRT